VSALVALIMRGRSHAMTASALSAALSLLFPPLSYASGAVIGLATLKHGPREGLWIIAGSVPLAALFAVLMLGTATPALAFLGMTWLPAWLMAVVLGFSRSQGMAVVVATGLDIVAVLVMHVIVDDPVGWWRHLLAEFFAPAMRGAQAPEVAQLNALIDAWAPRMTRIFGAVSVVGLVATLLISRYWHAMLDNPGGFGREFRELRVGTPAIGVGVVVAVAAWLFSEGPGDLASDLLGPLSVMLVFQGLAVVHSIASRRKLSMGWLVAMYVLLLVPPHIALPALAMTGVVDGLMNLRARAAGNES
jgi:hypothetical protein